MSTPTQDRLIDHAEREAAVDPTQSCIVQAPAGSGKTTLLVQRYLNLLATVNRPEEILAITFTNKAAAEMRGRVISLLTEPQPTPAAVAVKARSAELGWNIERYPNRLRIQTIDAFATYLVGQLPVTAGTQQLPIHPNPASAYETAVNRVFNNAINHNSELLAHFLGLNGHRESSARSLLEGMLARREQWLHLLLDEVARPTPEHLTQRLQDAIDDIQQQAIQALQAQLGQAITIELVDLGGFALACLTHDPVRCENLPEALTPIDGEPDAHQWRFLAGLLVTQKAKLGKPEGRKQVSVKDGFPASKDDQASAGTTKDIASANKQRIKQLLQDLYDQPQVQKAAVAVRDMPVDAISDDQLADLQVITTLLLQCVAELTQVFAEAGGIDFNQITLSAITALGDEDNPTDLALNLDYRISHLLIDEFQDTSRAHFELFSRIMHGWQIDDGRTFFAVGDPMQSVYRFRNAEVAMFLDCCARGINDLPLRYLALTTNFRSQAHLIHYFNASFSQVLGQHNDANFGQVAYSSASLPPNRKEYLADDSAESSLTQLLLADDYDQQLAAIVDHIRYLTHDTGTDYPDIAILVTTRTVVPDLVSALEQASIPWQGTELHPLADTAIVSDLYTLAQVLRDPFDRLSFSTLLRCPMVGMSLIDIHACLTPVADWQSWESALAEPAAELTPDGAARLEHLRTALHLFWPQRLELAPRELIQAVWLHLGGPSAYSKGERANAERFLDVLEQRHPQQLDLALLENDLAAMYAEDTGSGVRIMTMHKSKGLQFKHVLLPSLERSGKRDTAPLIQARETNQGLLITHKGDGDAYRWLTAEEAERSRNERKRLLYVGMTRAEESLALFATLPPSKKPRAGSLLDELQCVYPDRFAEREQMEELDEEELANARIAPPLTRLTQPFPALPEIRPRFAGAFERNAPSGDDSLLVPAPRRAAILRGILIHDELCRLSKSQSQPNDGSWRLACQREGLPTELAEQVCYEVAEQLQAIRSSRLGQWCVLHPHPNQASEMALTLFEANQLRDLVVDRTFVHEGARWVIDYKTASPDTEQTSQSQWLREQLQTYQGQLAIYGRAFHELESPDMPIRLAIYFTAIDQVWEYLFAADDHAQGDAELLELALPTQPNRAAPYLPS